MDNVPEADSPELNELKQVYPELNTAAGELLASLGPSFTGTPEGHIETDIAGAASVAGATLLRAVVPDLERHRAGDILLADVHDGQGQLLRFMAAISPGMGLSPDNGWNDAVPSEHEPLLRISELVGKLQGPFEHVVAQAGVPSQFRGHVAALAAMKLVAAGHEMGLLDQRVGKALVTHYLIAGSKTVPPTLGPTR